MLPAKPRGEGVTPVALHRAPPKPSSSGGWRSTTGMWFNPYAMQTAAQPPAPAFGYYVLTTLAEGLPVTKWEWGKTVSGRVTPRVHFPEVHREMAPLLRSVAPAARNPSRIRGSRDDCHSLGLQLQPARVAARCVPTACNSPGREPFLRAQREDFRLRPRPSGLGHAPSLGGGRGQPDSRGGRRLHAAERAGSVQRARSEDFRLRPRPSS